ncbi:MAG: signal peptidase I [Anaerolineaceae bacterium]|nr:signal peptidase I [Anaerolineaceae bacterium]
MDIAPETPLVEPEPKKKSEFWKQLLELVETLLLAVLLYFAIDAVFARVRVENISMQPTLYQGDVLVVNKLAYKVGNFKTGDIVVFHNPNNEVEDYIKRIIGTPGDTVDVANGQVSVNGNVLTEYYIAAAPNYEGEWIVPADSIFVLGDNRNQSSDSHEWGFVPSKDVVGKALFIYWPPQAMKILSDPYK